MAAPTHETALARKFRVDIDTGYPGAATWTQLLGVSDFTVTVDETQQSTSDYDSDWEGSQRTKLKFSGEITILRKQTFAGVLDPAAEYIRASADQFGQAGHVHLRWYDRDGGPEAYEAYCWAKWERANSGEADLEAVKIGLTDVGSGRVAITNPAA